MDYLAARGEELFGGDTVPVPTAGELGFVHDASPPVAAELLTGPVQFLQR
ncbi:MULTISPECIES: hypothetical protein [Streptomyces]|nr:MULTISPECIES: hypothetical protein [Streptomyces]NDZ97790.1 hypothetical protein [Streptomyces sp. SID10116]MYY82386.1 hypothetical protein [Streptomyces sp. SID335]MYZ17891.1 hypothetical protein [Streptomyces sp. SID337]NDZ88730.1 hypothetical protein [Streptomyces sp. SID10115]NEB47551.1 hypothetical protein [Streptomyces sp. SID339]